MKKAKKGTLHLPSECKASSQGRVTLTLTYSKSEFDKEDSLEFSLDYDRYLYKSDYLLIQYDYIIK